MRIRVAVAPRFTIGVCCVAMLALTPAAARSAPVTLGAGSHPRVAVDGAGTGYITWIVSAPSADTFHYCKLPAGATACAASFTFTDGDQDVDGGYALLPGENRVLLLEARGVSPDRKKYLWTSTDGGVTFAGPVQIGTLMPNGAGIAAPPSSRQPAR